MYQRFLFISVLALSAGCSNRAMVKGALTPKERQEYVEQTGALIPQRLRAPFIAGNAAIGMTKEMVAFIYGQPDRTENSRYGITWGNGESELAPVPDIRDSVWNYFGTDSVSVRRGLRFNGDTVVQITGEANR